MEIFTNNIEVWLIAALAVSEALALFPDLKSNSVFTLVVNLLKSIKS